MKSFLKFLLLLTTIIRSNCLSAQSYDGLTFMQLEEWDNAVATFTTNSKANPTDQSSLLQLGNAFLAKGNPEEARKAFETALTIKQEGALSLICNGRLLLLKGNDAEAEAIFKRAQKAAKKDINAARQIGESYIYRIPVGSKKPNYAKAIEWLNLALEVNSKDFATLLSIGYCYREMSNGGKSAEFYEYAEQAQPQNALPSLMIAKVYRVGKVNDKFEQYIGKAISKAPKFAASLRENAYYLYREKRYKDATQAFKELLERGDRLVIEDEMSLANSLFLIGDCTACSDLVEKIMKKDQTKNYLRRLQAYCDYENGNYSRGLEVLNAYFNVVEADKIMGRDYEYLAKLNIKTKGDTTLALQNMFKAIEMDADRRGDLLKEISTIQYGRKDYCSAAISYQMYLDSAETKTSLDYYNLGLRHFYCKGDILRYEKALVNFSKVTEMQPDKAIGWLWVAKTNAKLDPNVEAHPELATEFGKAHDAFEKYIAIASADPIKNKKDLIAAYEYQTYYHYNRNELVAVKENAEKLLSLDPSNETGTELLKIANDTPPPPVKEGGN
jgi:tetratricopeptide (TPR) repeat protein